MKKFFLFFLFLFLSINLTGFVFAGGAPTPPTGITAHYSAPKKSKKVKKQKIITLLPMCITQTGNQIITHPFNGVGDYGYGYSYYPTGTLWWLGGERNFDGFIIYTPLRWWTDNDYKKEEEKK